MKEEDLYEKADKEKNYYFIARDTNTDFVNELCDNKIYVSRYLL